QPDAPSQFDHPVEEVSWRESAKVRVGRRADPGWAAGCVEHLHAKRQADGVEPKAADLLQGRTAAALGNAQGGEGGAFTAEPVGPSNAKGAARLINDLTADRDQLIAGVGESLGSGWCGRRQARTEQRHTGVLVNHPTEGQACRKESSPGRETLSTSHR